MDSTLVNVALASMADQTRTSTGTLFAVWERRAGEPGPDMTLFRNVRFGAASFSITVAFFGLLAMTRC